MVLYSLVKVMYSTVWLRWSSVACGLVVCCCSSVWFRNVGVVLSSVRWSAVL